MIFHNASAMSNENSLQVPHDALVMSTILMERKEHSMFPHVVDQWLVRWGMNVGEDVPRART